MSHDSDRKPEDRPEKSEGTGASEARKGRNTAPGEAADESPGDKKEIQVALVDEVLETEQYEMTVSDQIVPSTDVSEPPLVSVESISKADIEVSRLGQEVDTIVNPGEHHQSASIQHNIPVIERLEAHPVAHSTAEVVTPAQDVEQKDEVQLVGVQEIIANRLNQPVNHKVTPAQYRTQGREPMELDEDDPVFTWTGGSPYNSGRPKLVIHRSPEELSTLPFLRVLLRDTYKEIEGGEPGAETVEFVANEPRIPQIQKNIVTLNLTEDAWQSDMRDENPVIERNDIDIVPKLREVAATLYTGELGYFVVNVPNTWEGDLIQEDFFGKLVERVANAGVSEADEGGGVFEVLESSPVVVANPKIETKEELFSSVSQYFSLEDSVGKFVSVDQIEHVKEQTLRQNDWKRIALTERQSREDESDEHYFWKAIIAEGLARELWKYHETNRRPNQDDRPFGEFLKQEILSKETIRTEVTVGDTDDNSGIKPDILIGSVTSTWMKDALKEFLNRDENLTRDVVIEFETGRSEGAFNFRKIRETLEKYPTNGVSGTAIQLVLPVRLFFRGEQRARMILDLIESWNDEDPGQRLSATALVPVLRQGSCRGLKSANQLVEDLYGEEEE